ncbi:MAG TPA: hypothetical protein VGD66_04750 [Allosphingosinicella sp.]|jgi:hypothetical protein
MIERAGRPACAARAAAAFLLAFAAPAFAAPPDAPPAGAAPLTAEQALKNYYDGFSDAMRGAGCAPTGTVDDIVVCGRGAPAQRGDFPRAPGEIVRHANEPGSGRAALTAGGCDRLCSQPLRLDVIKIVRGAPAALRRLLGKD